MAPMRADNGLRPLRMLPLPCAASRFCHDASDDLHLPDAQAALRENNARSSKRASLYGAIAHASRLRFVFAAVFFFRCHGEARQASMKVVAEFRREAPPPSQVPCAPQPILMTRTKRCCYTREPAAIACAVTPADTAPTPARSSTICLTRAASAQRAETALPRKHATADGYGR